MVASKSIFGKKTLSAVGLDIGTYAVKLVKLSIPEKGNPTLMAMGMRELPPNAIVEKDIRDSEGVIYTIQTLVEQVAPEITDVIINLSGHKVFTDRIQIALTGKKMKLGEAVMLEAEQRIPTGTEGISVDYYPLGKTPDGKMEDVILVAARRELVESYIAAVRDAGLDPIIVDTDFFAMYNVFEVNYGIPDEGVIALINIGHALTNITVIIDGSYYTVRDVSSGARAVWDSIQSELRLNQEDMDDLIKGEFPIEDPREYKEAAFIAAEELKLGLDVAFGYIESVTNGRTIDQAYVAGGGAVIEGVVDALSSKMSLPIISINPFKTLTPAKGVFSGMDPDKIGPVYANAIGMALRG